jgi:4-diphosphocytidyl-2-C-methyl-D-erythritol kinase
VVAIADGGLSTPDVYAECDRLRGDTPVPEPRVADALMAALRTGDADALGAALHNDLQMAACSLRPSLRETLETGTQAGALGSLVSGSGPSVVFLARSPEHAIDIAVALSATGTCRSVRRAHGPVAGARVVGDG